MSSPAGHFDVVVLGGGPAGIAAAKAAAAAAVSVALVQQGPLGGACVHETCVPTEILLRTATGYLSAQYLDALGIIGLAGRYQHAKAIARKDELVRYLSGAVARSLTRLPIEVLNGHGALLAADRVGVRSGGAQHEVRAGAVVLANGCAWTPPTIDGLPADRLITPDVIQSQALGRGSVTVLPSANSGGLFPLEYAAYLSAAGVAVDVLGSGSVLLPGIDSELDPLVVAAFEAAGCTVHLGLVAAGYDGKLHLQGEAGELTLDPEFVLAADPRTPNTAAVGLDRIGLRPEEAVVVDTHSRSSAGVYAAGDITGGPMLSGAASIQGAIAGANAAGGSLSLHPGDQQPFVLHGPVPAGWVGLSEERARAAGEAVIGIADAAGSAQAVVTASEGTAVKLVANGLGQLLGVHVVGDGSAEIIEAAATLIQLEMTVDDVAALRPWHPSWTELLIDAARAAGS